jgi:hypothetical protein
MLIHSVLCGDRAQRGAGLWGEHINEKTLVQRNSRQEDDFLPVLPVLRELSGMLQNGLPFVAYWGYDVTRPSGDSCQPEA